MILDLSKTIHALKQLNKKCRPTIIKKKEFEEREAALNDIEEKISEINILLKKIESENYGNDVSVVTRDLIYLHVRYCDIMSHIDFVDDMIKDMIIKYDTNYKKSDNTPNDYA